MISGIGISYAPAPDAGRPSGRRAPDVPLREGRLYELLRRGEFVLIAPRGATPELPATAPVTPKHLVRATWTDPAKKAVVLVRPDGYVQWAKH